MKTKVESIFWVFMLTHLDQKNVFMVQEKHSVHANVTK